MIGNGTAIANPRNWESDTRNTREQQREEMERRMTEMRAALKEAEDRRKKRLEQQAKEDDERRKTRIEEHIKRTEEKRLKAMHHRAGVEERRRLQLFETEKRHRDLIDKSTDKDVRNDLAKMRLSHNTDNRRTNKVGEYPKSRSPSYAMPTMAFTNRTSQNSGESTPHAMPFSCPRCRSAPPMVRLKVAKTPNKIENNLVVKRRLPSADRSTIEKNRVTMDFDGQPLNGCYPHTIKFPRARPKYTGQDNQVRLRTGTSIDRSNKVLLDKDRRSRTVSGNGRKDINESSDKSTPERQIDLHQKLRKPPAFVFVAPRVKVGVKSKADLDSPSRTEKSIADKPPRPPPLQTRKTITSNNLNDKNYLNDFPSRELYDSRNQERLRLALEREASLRSLNSDITTSNHKSSDSAKLKDLTANDKSLINGYNVDVNTDSDDKVAISDNDHFKDIISEINEDPNKLSHETLDNLGKKMNPVLSEETLLANISDNIKENMDGIERNSITETNLIADISNNLKYPKEIENNGTIKNILKEDDPSSNPLDKLNFKDEDVHKDKILETKKSLSEDIDNKLKLNDNNIEFKGLITNQSEKLHINSDNEKNKETLGHNKSFFIEVSEKLGIHSESKENEQDIDTKALNEDKLPEKVLISNLSNKFESKKETGNNENNKGFISNISDKVVIGDNSIKKINIYEKEEKNGILSNKLSINDNTEDGKEQNNANKDNGIFTNISDKLHLEDKDEEKKHVNEDKDTHKEVLTSFSDKPCFDNKDGEKKEIDKDKSKGFLANISEKLGLEDDKKDPNELNDSHQGFLSNLTDKLGFDDRVEAKKEINDHDKDKGFFSNMSEKLGLDDKNDENKAFKDDKDASKGFLSNISEKLGLDDKNEDKKETNDDRNKGFFLNKSEKHGIDHKDEEKEHINEDKETNKGFLSNMTDKLGFDHKDNVKEPNYDVDKGFFSNISEKLGFDDKDEEKKVIDENKDESKGFLSNLSDKLSFEDKNENKKETNDDNDKGLFSNLAEKLGLDDKDEEKNDIVGNKEANKGFLSNLSNKLSPEEKNINIIDTDEENKDKGFFSNVSGKFFLDAKDDELKDTVNEKDKGFLSNLSEKLGFDDNDEDKNETEEKTDKDKGFLSNLAEKLGFDDDDGDKKETDEDKNIDKTFLSNLSDKLGFDDKEKEDKNNDEDKDKGFLANLSEKLGFDDNDEYKKEMDESKERSKGFLSNQSDKLDFDDKEKNDKDSDEDKDKGFLANLSEKLGFDDNNEDKNKSEEEQDKDKGFLSNISEKLGLDDKDEISQVGDIKDKSFLQEVGEKLGIIDDDNKTKILEDSKLIPEPGQEIDDEASKSNVDVFKNLFSVLAAQNKNEQNVNELTETQQSVSEQMEEIGAENEVEEVKQKEVLVSMFSKIFSKLSINTKDKDSKSSIDNTSSNNDSDSSKAEIKLNDLEPKLGDDVMPSDLSTVETEDGEDAEIKKKTFVENMKTFFSNIKNKHNVDIDSKSAGENKSDLSNDESQSIDSYKVAKSVTEENNALSHEDIVLDNTKPASG